MARSSVLEADIIIAGIEPGVTTNGFLTPVSFAFSDSPGGDLDHDRGRALSRDRPLGEFRDRLSVSGDPRARPTEAIDMSAHECRLCGADVDEVLVVDGIGYCHEHGNLARRLDRDLLAPLGKRKRRRQGGDGRDPIKLVEDPDSPVPIEEIQAMIRGIDRLETIAYWLQLEHRFISRGPREAIVDLLENRRDELEAIGERPERVDVGSADRSHKPAVEWEGGRTASSDEDAAEADDELYHDNCGSIVERREEYVNYGLYCPECDQVTKSVSESPPSEVSA